uniref:Cid1 n=1 Tax=Drosophila barbarae TaxID=137354 RepID=A0A1V0HRI2_9MUSC|nr:Cid1 [Drosophila barbarae]
MRPLRVQESHGDDSTDSSSSGSMQMLDHYMDLESVTSRLSLESADDQSSSTVRRTNRQTSRGQEDQENRPPASRQTHQNSVGGQAGAAASAPRRRKQRGPVSRANRMNREMRRLRECTTPLIPRLSFSRLVRELIMKCSGVVPFRITESALGALQESSELFLTQRFEDAYLLTLHRGRVTLEVRDMALIAYIVQIGHSY